MFSNAAHLEDLQAIWLFTYSRSSLLDAAKFLVLRKSFIQVYGSELMKNPPGQYELAISELPDDWLIPFRDLKHGKDYREQGPS